MSEEEGTQVVSVVDGMMGCGQGRMASKRHRTRRERTKKEESYEQRGHGLKNEEGRTEGATKQRLRQEALER